MLLNYISRLSILLIVFLYIYKCPLCGKTMSSFNSFDCIHLGELLMLASDFIDMINIVHKLSILLIVFNILTKFSDSVGSFNIFLSILLIVFFKNSNLHTHVKKKKLSILLIVFIVLDYNTLQVLLVAFNSFDCIPWFWSSSGNGTLISAFQFFWLYSCATLYVWEPWQNNATFNSFDCIRPKRGHQALLERSSFQFFWVYSICDLWC